MSDGAVATSLVTPPDIPWLADGAPPIAIAPCPEGWREVVDVDLTTCDPYPEAGPAGCDAGDAHFPGEPGCRPVGDPCPAGDYASSLPADGSVVYVDADAPTGGDGSLTTPFSSLAEVRWGTLTPGTTVALAKGTYPGTLPLRAGVHVVGACAAQTIVTGVAAPVLAVVTVTNAGEPASVRNITIEGAPQIGVLLEDGHEIVLEGVIIERARLAAVFVQHAATSVVAANLVLRDTASDGGSFGRGIGAQGGAHFEAHGCGDGALDLASGEECDDGNTASGDGCSASCQLEAVGAFCGDGTMDPGEACDDSNVANGDACNPTCNLTNMTSLFVGSPGMRGNTDGMGTAARIGATGVLAADSTSLWLAQEGGGGGMSPVLRRIEIATATVSTVATLAAAGGIATNGTDTLWVAGGSGIQSISTSAPFTVTNIHAGAGATGAGNFRDGAPGTATFGDVRGLTWYGGVLFIVDTAAAVIRQMDPATGGVTTVAGMPYATGGGDGIGSAARFTSPRYIVSDNSGMLYISDTNGQTIRAMNARTFRVTTFAGVSGMAGYVDGVGTAARIHRPRGITADGSSIYFTEFNAHTIRQGVLATGEVSTLVGMSDTSLGSTGGYAEGTGTAAEVAGPFSVVYHFPSRSLFFVDGGNSVIRRVQ